MVGGVSFDLSHGLSELAHGDSLSAVWTLDHFDPWHLASSWALSGSKASAPNDLSADRTMMTAKVLAATGSLTCLFAPTDLRNRIANARHEEDRSQDDEEDDPTRSHEEVGEADHEPSP